ncbi:enoyl-CoA hydratase/isomerase family protein [Nakamurella lactea]|uniref:enoyl-CoA hydratase/isomerase family protein n=1 Tax=Nakamurella lactea TaxID=459515 RepID=UPI0004157D19|nr:enoyl-CoA hydratase/isomerase family protein [Nakamurella lactea]
MTSSPSPAGPAASAATEPDLIATVRGRLGHLRLNRPRQINALSVELIDLLSAQLSAWADDDAVELVLVDGAGGRGLSAGGDIKALYAGILAGSGPGNFFTHEYAMNAMIAHYPKPYVAVMDGVTMGGGVGISGHGSVRIVTERSQVAMPETAIGLFPDVGALYLLARCPGELGTHLALTGARLNGPQAIGAGLADHYLPAAGVPELIERLEQGVAGLSRSAWATPPADLPGADIGSGWIDACYVGDRAEDILDRLDSRPEPAAGAAAATIRSMSPTSVKVTLAAIRRAASMTVDQVLAQDLALMDHFVRSHDLREGIRAQVIDKDRSPKWDPSTLDAVNDADVVALFL